MLHAKNCEALCVSCFAIPDVKHFFLYFSIEKVLLAKNREARSTVVGIYISEQEK